MSRSGYSDEIDDTWAWVRWRGAVASAIRGKRGQALLREAMAALDAMPGKRLIPHTFEDSGAFCTLGAVAAQRGIEPGSLNPGGPDYDIDHKKIAATFDAPPALVHEIMYMNDEGFEWLRDITPEERWVKMRKWIESQIRPEVVG